MKKFFEFLKSYFSSYATEKIFSRIILLFFLFFGIGILINHHNLHSTTGVALIAIAALLTATTGIIVRCVSFYRKMKVYLMTRKVQVTMPMNDDVIDLDADPFVPEGWTVEKHQNGGTFKWNPNEVLLYLSKLQKDGESIKGNKLREELVGRRIFNANLLDWLMVHQNLIPEEWKHDEQGHPLFIFFWGTIYNRPSGILCVRGIYWRGNRWHCSFRWLNDGWNGSSPAAMRVISIL